ncbi:MAG TPA: diguanylate cyclase, partial [Candidatus Dormibacteraeota bacterium]|nr:diguanylate cyclase [Candidatus Dormibacteraeota bacterium]
MASPRVRVLFVEDQVSDAELVLADLRRAGMDLEWERVDSEAAFRAKLPAGWDLILCDFNLPQFDAKLALAILKESGQDIPFIIVSGTISDQAAVDSMKGGASDYIFKDNLSRLAVAATRELDAADQRRSSVRARDESLARLQESESRFRGLFYDVAVGQALIGMPDGHVLAVNPAFSRLLGYQPDELVGRLVQFFADPEHGEAVRDAFHRLSRDLPTYHLESRLRHKRGGTVWASLGLSATFDEGDHPSDLLIQAHDITKRKDTEGALEEAQRQLVHHARFDALTELPNRTQLQDLVHEAIGQGEVVSLLVMNLDHFTEVNVSFGYLAGDELLKQLGPRIQECARREDLIARLGGDEFGIVLRGADQKTARLIADKVIAALERPFSVDGHPLTVEASIGIISFPEHAVTADLLMRRADIAMHVAKRAPGTAAVYSPEYEEEGASHLALMADLRAAIRDGGLSMHYQPLIDLKSGIVVRFEALLRWQHAVRGMVPPDQFIRYAEQTGVIQPLTDWVIRTVLEQTRAWHDAGHDLGVAVNISMRNLLDPGLPERIAEMIRESPPRTAGGQQLLSLEV